MSECAPAPDRAAASLLAAALAALDHDGESIAAAYVSMALERVERRTAPQTAR